jgi:hypothetical protein
MQEFSESKTLAGEVKTPTRLDGEDLQLMRTLISGGRLDEKGNYQVLLLFAACLVSVALRESNV